MTIDANAFQNGNNTASNTTYNQTSSSYNSSPYLNGQLLGLMSPMSAIGKGNAQYEAVYKAGVEIIKESFLNRPEEAKQYRIIKDLRAATGLAQSTLTLTRRVGNRVYGHALTFESTTVPGFEQNSKITRFRDVSYEIITTPSDAYSPEAVDTLAQSAANSWGVKIEDVIIVGMTLVPTEFASTDEDNVKRLWENSFKAVLTEAEVVENGYLGVNIKQWLKNNGSANGKYQISVIHNSGNEAFEDQTGLPVRRDVAIAVTYHHGNNNSTGVGYAAPEKITEVVTTFGYVDFDRVNPRDFGKAYDLLDTQIFMPNFVITHMESPFALTPDIVMQGMLSVLTLKQDMAWMSLFRPTVGGGKKGEVNYDNIGALNIEANIRNLPETYGEVAQITDPEKLSSFLLRVAVDDLVISIDLPKAGANTWWTSTFDTAHMGKAELAASAINRLSAFFVNATDGLYPGLTDTPFLRNQFNRFHTGFYKDSVTKSFKDLRSIVNYLAMANHLEDTKQPFAKLVQYSRTLFDSNLGTEERMAARRELMLELTNKGAHIKGSATRVTLNSRAAMELLDAYREAGFDPVLSNQSARSDVFTAPPTANYTSAVYGHDVRLTSYQRERTDNRYYARQHHRRFD